MKDTSSQILSNHNISGKFWQMRAETGWQRYVPGQFVMFQVPGNKAFLRRPFCIARMEGGVVEICYKVIGAGTLVMSALKVGDKVNVLGPLGNGFQISNVVTELTLQNVAQTFRSANIGRSKDLRYELGRATPRLRSEHGSATTLKLLVAGGYGVAPLLGLAERLGNGVHLFYGAKTRTELLYLDDFKKLGVELHIATEDGSTGEKGLVTDILQCFLRMTHDARRTTIFACGPRGMLHIVAELALQKYVAEGFSLPLSGGTLKGSATSCDCQLSLESYMGCGYGVCMGCAVKLTNGEYARVCKDGPVFNAKALMVDGL